MTPLPVTSINATPSENTQWGCCMKARSHRRTDTKAGVPHVSLHELARHSKGGQLINRGVSLEMIGALLGHSSTQTTKRYAKLRTESLRGLVE